MWPSKDNHTQRGDNNDSIIFTQAITRPDRRQFVSQSVYVPSNQRIASAANRAAQHYAKKA